MDDFNLRMGAPLDAPGSPSPLARLNTEWILAQFAYETAGRPFGDSIRALEVWIEYGRQSTAN